MIETYFKRETEQRTDLYFYSAFRILADKSRLGIFTKASKQQAMNAGFLINLTSATVPKRLAIFNNYEALYKDHVGHKIAVSFLQQYFCSHTNF